MGQKEMESCSRVFQNMMAKTGTQLYEKGRTIETFGEGNLRKEAGSWVRGEIY